MAPKQKYHHKYSPEVLEQIGASCNIAANSRNESDWQLFLSAIYDAIMVLTDKQRIILLMSQEIGLSFVDIGRILNMPISTVVQTLKTAIDKVVFYLQSRSLTKKNLFSCKALNQIYIETIDFEECNCGKTDFEFLGRVNQAPWFCRRNFLYESVYAQPTRSEVTGSKKA